MVRISYEGAKMKLFLSILILLLTSPLAFAIDLNDMLLHKAQKFEPFWGNHCKNIKWIKHVPDETAESYEGEAGSGGQTDIGIVDLDGDGKDEEIRVIWGHGVTDHSLTIELYKNDIKFDTLKPICGGIQSNYKFEDLDGDGKLEIIIWEGMWDFRMPGEDDITEETYEGHSGLHRYVVATYKLLREKCYLWDIYTTKKKYEPFCEQQPKE